MSLVADYSSDSDTESNHYINKQDSSTNITASKIKAKPNSKKAQSGPFKIVVDAPKKIQDDSSDEDTSKQTIPTTSKVSSLTFSKLKFKGNGSSLFGLLPPPKTFNSDDQSSETPTSKHSILEASVTSENTKNSNLPKTTVTSFVPTAVKNKIASGSNNSASFSTTKKIKTNPTSLSESLFPIGTNIQDSYTSEVSLVDSNATYSQQHLANSQQNENSATSSTTQSDSFYYGYDYSSNNPGVVSYENDPSASSDSYNNKPEFPDSLPEEAERFFGGNRKRNRNQPINILDIDLGKEMTTPEALQARAIRASGGSAAGYSSLNNDTNSMYKKRHNIVFLAQQARSREDELEDRYAENRRTKRETKSKYGF